MKLEKDTWCDKFVTGLKMVALFYFFSFQWLEDIFGIPMS